MVGANEGVLEEKGLGTEKPSSLSEPYILLLCAILILFIFILDINLRISFLVSSLYCIPLVICIWSPKRRTIFIVAVAATVLTLIAVPLKPSGDITIPLFNRPTSLLVLWIITILVDRFSTARKKAHTTLSETKDYLQNLLDYANIPIIVWNPDHTIMMFNHAFERLTGLSSDEVTGKPLGVVFTEKDSPNSMDLIQKTSIGERWEEVEIPVRGTNGSLRTILWNSANITSSEGKIISTIAQGVDVTERKRVEHRLKASEQRYRSLFETAQDGILILDLESERIIDANKYILDMIGQPLDAIVDKSLWELGFVEDRPLAEKAFSELKRNGYVRYENIPLKRINGEIVNVEFISNVYMVNETKIIQCNIRDITERKRSELKLATARQRLTEVYRLAHIGTYNWIIESDTVTWSKELYEISGRDPSLPPPSFKEQVRIYTPASWRSLTSSVAKAIATGEPFDLELDMVRPDGSIRKIDAIGNGERDAEGKVIEFQGLVQDITERRRLEGALQEANRKLNLLSSITRHDINNQLMLLSGSLALLKARNADLAGDENFQYSEAASKRISAMIQFTKEYEDIGVRAPGWQDVHALLMSASAQASLERARVVNDVPAGTEVFADPLIVRVFLNLMNNSVRHGGKTTIIRFYFDEVDGKPSIICEDDGDGISPELKQSLFTRGSGKDHGLGLFLSHEILSITGINITERGDPGQGAKFVITVPSEGFRAAGLDRPDLISKND